MQIFWISGSGPAHDLTEVVSERVAVVVVHDGYETTDGQHDDQEQGSQDPCE